MYMGMIMYSRPIIIVAFFCIALLAAPFSRLHADQADARLPALFEALKNTSDAVAAEAIAGQIWAIWSEHGDDERLSQNLQLGTAQMNAGRLRQAEQIFTTIIDTDPAFAEAWNKRATVYFTTMVKALAEAGLASYSPRVGVQLIPQGRALALHVLRRHRLIEQFLVEVLGFDWSEVHEEAELLEHVISDRLLERIDQRLGHPTEDPHGDPIPSAEGELPQDSLQTLADCDFGVPYEVARVSDQDNTFLHYLTEVGLNPGARIMVTARSAGADSVTLVAGDPSRELTLGLSAAGKLLVRELVR